MHISNVDASLSRGKLLDGKHIMFLYFAISVTLLLPVITIIVLIAQVEWDIQMISALTLGNIIFLSFLAVLIFILLNNKKIKKEVSLWLEDAVEMKAYSKKIDENRLGIQPKAVKIQVKFMIENKTYQHESTAKSFGGWTGYLGVFRKYANREIKILYSPKYDEVLILKDN